MYHPGETQSDAYLDTKYCMAHAQDYARRGFVSRVAAYKACLMEKGYVSQ